MLNFHGDNIYLDALQQLLHRLEKDIRDQFETKIMLNLKLHVQCSHIADDLSRNVVGYSFVSDHRNPFLSHRTSLLHAILHHPTLRDQFIYFIDNKLYWKRSTLQQWLNDYTQLELLLLLRCEMLSGGPARGSELTAMQFRSTSTRDSRNLVYVGNHMTMIRHYSKTSHLTGQDRVIPHSLDAFTSDLLLQNLVLARPFAELVIMELYPTAKQLHSLFYNNLFVRHDRLFTSSDLSMIMKQYTNKYLKVELGLRSWRHIAIAFRRKLCTIEKSLLEDNIEDTIYAEQAGHTLQTERRIYGLSPESLITQAEDILPIYLKASSEWQSHMKTVPGK